MDTVVLKYILPIVTIVGLIGELQRPNSVLHFEFLTYDTMRYDSVYLTCSKKLTGSQLSPA